MIFELGFSDRAKEQLKALKTNKGLTKHQKVVQEAFKKLQRDPKINLKIIPIPPYNCLFT